MSIFKRVGNIIRSNKQQEPVRQANPIEESRVGDIVNVDLEEYVVTGKVIYFDRGFEPHRYAYYLQSGKDVRCLLIEKGRSYECFLCDFMEGALDDPNDVPSRLELDGEDTFELEHHRSDVTRTEGNTDFRSGDEVMIWRYFGPDDRYFFLQWQDGKFVAMQGERTPASQVKFMRATL
ncbi:DUF4178 domain-containing protein [Paenibacillus chitinolyticus]|uniref:DUF4178 domain-containing protein n=1 Tax=Paenibacillus chitinolyticus TaxID=79263 RepID=UPI0026E4F645|nr:DUF4178 domain-containing protein [Paenibacillus chitinolyticus]GKS09061.1 hypothetical protein YDYSY3_00610 [Paenibacillus chitinolyticus]